MWRSLPLLPLLMVLMASAGQRSSLLADAAVHHIKFYDACLNNAELKDLKAPRDSSSETVDANTTVSVVKREIDHHAYRMKRALIIGERLVNITIGEKYSISFLNTSEVIKEDYSCRLTFQPDPAAAMADNNTNTRYYLQVQVSHDWELMRCPEEITMTTGNNKNYYYSCKQNLDNNKNVGRQSEGFQTHNDTDVLSIQYDVNFIGLSNSEAYIFAPIKITIQALKVNLHDSNSTGWTPKKSDAWIGGTVFGVFFFLICVTGIVHCCNVAEAMANPTNALRGGNNHLLGMGVGALVGHTLMKGQNGGGNDNLLMGNTGVQQPYMTAHPYATPPYGYASPPQYGPPAPGAPQYGPPAPGAPQYGTSVPGAPQYGTPYGMPMQTNDYSQSYQNQPPPPSHPAPMPSPSGYAAPPLPDMTLAYPPTATAPSAPPSAPQSHSQTSHVQQKRLSLSSLGSN